MRVIALFTYMFLATCAVVSDALAETRIALVIGNSSYVNVPSLPNPANDAAAVAQFFKDAKFDDVQLRINIGIAELRKAVGSFADRAADADVAVIYFAGHGIEMDGINYVIPSDAKLARDFDLEDEALSLDRMLKSVESVRRLRLVILDACRDNPFVKTMRRSTASRSIGRGLAKIEPTTSNTLIAFAAKAGSVALDGDGQNSPFTTSVIRQLAVPDLDLRLAFGRVRDDVLRSTGQKQEPFVYGSLGGQTVAIVESKGIDNPVEQPRPLQNEAAQAWTAVKDTTSVAILENFATRFRGSFYADLARARINELQLSNPASKGASRPGAPRKSANLEPDVPSQARPTKSKNRQQSPSTSRWGGFPLQGGGLDCGNLTGARFGQCIRLSAIRQRQSRGQ